MRAFIRILPVVVSLAFLQVRRTSKYSLRWAFSKLSNRQFLLVSAVIVGLWTGLSAVTLKIAVSFLQTRIQPLGVQHRWVYILSPILGFLFTTLFVQFVLGGHLLKGTSHVLLAIATKSSVLPRKETYGHLATSALTVGAGGSAGLESPIVQTGSAIGSVFASFFPLGFRDRTLLLACGAAAGIATAFDAPIAGVLFALEILLVDVSVSTFIPLLIAGATGALCSKVILSEGILLSFRGAKLFNYHNIPYYIILGVLCGLVSVFYLWSLLKTEAAFNKIFKSRLLRIVAGGTFLGLIILIFPALFGEGYVSIKALAALKPAHLFEGSPVLGLASRAAWGLGALVFLTGLTKVFAVSLTLNAGGNGGNFAPSLLVGACLGFAFSDLANNFLNVNIPTANFCLVAMAGILAGIFHSPLTAIFLIAEITGGYDLIIPLMVVSAISTAVSKYLRRHSLDEAKLHQLAEPVSFGKDTHILSQFSIAGFLETDFMALRQGSTFKSLADAIGHSKRNIFPIVNEENELAGIIALEDIRKVMFQTDRYDTALVDQFMRQPIVTAEIDDDMNKVMEKFDKTGVWNIPVLKNGQYVGFISKSMILTTYRIRLKEGN